MHRTQQAIDRGLVHRAMHLTLLALSAVLAGLVTAIFAARAGDFTFYGATAAGAAAAVVVFTLGIKALEYLLRG
ncbi:hypothetical protein ACIOHS_25995 [Streptomyces sp. NPDC088253]|uniref:hypothetical protein n=1 Tax=Streptomyces sp. NPDC088253 TaxID=3365846 RepID=UPI00381249DE